MVTTSPTAEVVSPLSEPQQELKSTPQNNHVQLDYNDLAKK